MRHFAISFCLLLLFGNISVAQAPADPFQEVKLGEGLDINVVTDMKEGPSGFLWISSWMGLYRYDGHIFKGYPIVSLADSFRNAPCMEVFRDSRDRIWTASSLFSCIYSPSKDSLIPFGPPMLYGPHQKYNKLFLEDTAGNIWRSSQQGLQKILTRYPSGDTFPLIHYQHIRGDASSLPDQVVNSMVLDLQGRLWIGTNAGLCTYLPQEDRFLSHPAFYEKVIISIARGAEGALFIGTLGEGLYVFHPDTDSVYACLPQEGKTGKLQGKEIRKISLDHSGGVWLLTSDKSAPRFWLEYFDPKSRKFKSYLSPFSCTLMPDIISAQIHCDKQGRIWFAHEQGIYRFQAEQDRFQKMEGIDLSLQEQGWVNFWYEDPQGLMWVGFLKHGLFKYAPSRNKFSYLQHDPQNPLSISTNEQAYVFVDSKGWIWLTPQKGRVEKIRLDKNYQVIEKKQYPWNGRISGEDINGNLWVHLFPGVSLFDPESEKFIQHFRYSPMESNGLSDPRVGEVKEGADGDLWISTFGGGLNRYDPLNRSYRHYVHHPTDTNSIIANAAGPIVFDYDSNLWFGTNRGLSRYHAEQDNFTTYLQGVQLGGHYLYPDSSFWISSGNYGLFNLHTHTGKVKRYTYQNSGLPTNRLNSLLFDDDHNLWIASDKGIIFFDVQQNRFRLYDESDGIRSTQFYIFHGRKLASGEILFPLLDQGILIFHPDSIRDRLTGPRLKLVNFDLLNQDKGSAWEKQKLQEILDTEKGLVLAYDQSAIAFEFVGLQFDAPEKQVFSYWLESQQDSTQLESGTNRRITFASLAWGSHKLHAKAKNFEGKWGPEYIIPIKVCRPWYANGWAYTIYFLLAAMGIFALYQNQRRRWRLQADLEMEHQEAARLLELNNFKSRLYTNITHEFRTPLTIILGVAEEIRQRPASWLAKGQQIIRRNARSLLQLVQQMLDLSKLESGAMSLHMVQGDVIPFFKYLLESYHSLAESRGLHLYFETALVGLIMDYDPEKLESIVSNLLSNAIKFTARGGSVGMQLAVETSHVAHTELPTADDSLQPKKYISLTITDTGRGIAAKDIRHIFDRFYQAEGDSERAVGGTGIGLALTQELVHFLGGKIEVTSEEEKGSAFTIRLPIHHQAPKNIETDKESWDYPEETESWYMPSVLAMDEKLQNGLTQLLVIEDNPDVMAYLQSILGKDYHFIAAMDGQDGWEKALALTPDIIISDVMMPGMNGFELCKKLKNDLRTSHIPVILLTAKADQDSRILGLAHGADAYLAKPFNKEELLVRLEKLLDLRRNLQQSYLHQADIPASFAVKGKEDQFVRQVRQIMEENLHQENFLLEVVWEEIGMSRPQFYRKFKAVTDLTPADYLLSLRLQKAYELLLHADLSVSEVAFQVGFRNAGHFSKKFSQQFGRTPNSLKNGNS